MYLYPPPPAAIYFCLFVFASNHLAFWVAHGFRGACSHLPADHALPFPRALGLSSPAARRLSIGFLLTHALAHFAMEERKDKKQYLYRDSNPELPSTGTFELN